MGAPKLGTQCSASHYFSVIRECIWCDYGVELLANDILQTQMILLPCLLS